MKKRSEKKADIQSKTDGNRVEAIDKLCECKHQIDFLREVFNAGCPEHLENGAEGLYCILDRISYEMMNSIEILERKTE